MIDGWMNYNLSRGRWFLIAVRILVLRRGVVWHASQFLKGGNRFLPELKVLKDAQEVHAGKAPRPFQYLGNWTGRLALGEIVGHFGEHQDGLLPGRNGSGDGHARQGRLKVGSAFALVNLEAGDGVRSRTVKNCSGFVENTEQLFKLQRSGLRGLFLQCLFDSLGSPDGIAQCGLLLFEILED